MISSEYMRQVAEILNTSVRQIYKDYFKTVHRCYEQNNTAQECVNTIMDLERQKHVVSPEDVDDFEAKLNILTEEAKQAYEAGATNADWECIHMSLSIAQSLLNKRTGG